MQTVKVVTVLRAGGAPLFGNRGCSSAHPSPARQIIEDFTPKSGPSVWSTLVHLGPGSNPDAPSVRNPDVIHGVSITTYTQSPRRWAGQTSARTHTDLHVRTRTYNNPHLNFDYLAPLCKKADFNLHTSSRSRRAHPSRRYPQRPRPLLQEDEDGPDLRGGRQSPALPRSRSG